MNVWNPILEQPISMSVEVFKAGWVAFCFCVNDGKQVVELLASLWLQDTDVCFGRNTDKPRWSIATTFELKVMLHAHSSTKKYMLKIVANNSSSYQIQNFESKEIKPCNNVSAPVWKHTFQTEKLQNLDRNKLVVDWVFHGMRIHCYYLLKSTAPYSAYFAARRNSTQHVKTEKEVKRRIRQSESGSIGNTLWLRVRARNIIYRGLPTSVIAKSAWLFRIELAKTAPCAQIARDCKLSNYRTWLRNIPSHEIQMKQNNTLQPDKIDQITAGACSWNSLCRLLKFAW